MPIIAEVLLVGATWRHAYTFKLASDTHAAVPLTTVLIRDGQHGVILLRLNRAEVSLQEHCTSCECIWLYGGQRRDLYCYA